MVRLVREFDVIGIENRNVKGMMTNEKLARHIADIGMHVFKRQLHYKAALDGARVIEVDRWFSSSKTCSACGTMAEKMPLFVREWTCACGAHHDRDLNAVKNLQRIALARASCARSYASGEDGAGAASFGSVKPASGKQESITSYMGMH